MKKKVDVAIIGAGTAGLNAMAQVQEVTDNFVLINGGTIRYDLCAGGLYAFQNLDTGWG